MTFKLTPMDADDLHNKQAAGQQVPDELLLELVRILAHVAAKEYLEELGKLEPDGQQIDEGER